MNQKLPAISFYLISKKFCMIFTCLCNEGHHNLLNLVGTSDVSPQNENLLFGFTIGEPVPVA